MNIDYDNTGQVALIPRSSTLSASDCARAGEAVGACVRGKVGVACAPGAQSLSCAMAAAAGLMNSGAGVWFFGEAVESQLSFFVPHCSLKAGLFADAQQGQMKLFGEDGLSVPLSFKRAVDAFLENPTKRAEKCGQIFDMRAFETLYADELLQSAPYGLRAECRVRSGNKKIEALMRDILPAGGEGSPIFRINRFGTGLSISTKQTGVVPFVKILAICGAHELRSGHDISVPFEAPRFLDELAQSYSRQAYRYLTAPCDLADSEARRLAAKQFWARDALFAGVKINSILTERGISFEELYAELPEFFVSRRVIELERPIEFLEMLSGAGVGSAEGGRGVVILSDEGELRLSPAGERKIFMTAQAADMEIAKELSDSIQTVIEKISRRLT